MKTEDVLETTIAKSSLATNGSLRASELLQQYGRSPTDHHSRECSEGVPRGTPILGPASHWNALGTRQAL